MVATELDNLYAWNGVRRHRELSAIIRSHTPGQKTISNWENNAMKWDGNT